MIQGNIPSVDSRNGTQGNIPVGDSLNESDLQQVKTL